MTNKKDIIIAVLATFCLASALFMILPSRSDPYDAWRDIDDDGDVDMKDIGYTIKSFGTMGDPTKNVTVTNWPRSSDVNVWFGYALPDGYNLNSVGYYSDGYSTLHILIRIGGLGSGETVEFFVYGHLYNATRTAYYPIPVYTYTFTSIDYDSAISIDVPSETFHFRVDAATGTICTLYLSYYLTWA